MSEEKVFERKTEGNRNPTRLKGIDKFIAKSEEITLTGEDIHRLTRGKANILAYPVLEQFSDLEEVFEGKDHAIILFETRKGFGHWISISKIGENQLEYFDPIGVGIDEELDLIPTQTRIELGEVEPHLTVLIRKSGKHIKVNKRKVQETAEDVNTCGRWATARIMFEEVQLNKFLDSMTKNKTYSPDFWVSALTIMI
jgi:hypothetical protein